MGDGEEYCDKGAHGERSYYLSTAGKILAMKNVHTKSYAANRTAYEEYREGVSLAALADNFDYTTLPQRVALLDTRGIAGGFTKFGTGLVGSAKQASQRRYLAASAVARRRRG